MSIDSIASTSNLNWISKRILFELDVNLPNGSDELGGGIFKS